VLWPSFITLFKAVGKQLAHEQAIKRTDSDWDSYVTEVGSTSRPVSLNPSIPKLFQTRGFRVPLMIYAWKVCVKGENLFPTPHLQNSQKSPRQI